jgi:hypothetical protein
MFATDSASGSQGHRFESSPRHDDAFHEAVTCSSAVWDYIWGYIGLFILHSLLIYLFVYILFIYLFIYLFIHLMQYLLMVSIKGL